MHKTSAPLFLLTRPRAASERFAESLRARLGPVRVIISPVIEINYLKPEMERHHETVIFASTHAVRGYHEAGCAPKTAALCVGERTAQAAREAGFQVCQTAPTLAALEPVLAHWNGALLHVRGTFTSAELAEKYTHIEQIITYDQRARTLSEQAFELLNGEEPVILPLFSPRSADQTAQQIKGNAPRFVVFMSEAVREAFVDVEMKQWVISDRPDADAVLDSSVALFDAACSLESRQRGR